MRLLYFLVLGFLAAPALAKNSNSVCDSDDQTTFNFWVGEWRVTDPKGKYAGDSKIVSVQDGCVIQENWRSATSDYTGTSYNAYNQKAKQWEQIWLDNKGGRLHLKGQRKAKQMILTTDAIPNKKGKSSYNQITWTANQDGTVRQYWEVYTQGESTTVSFDGIYTPAVP